MSVTILDRHHPASDDLLTKTIGYSSPVEKVNQDGEIAFGKSIAQFGQIRLGLAWITQVANYQVEVAPIVGRPLHSAAVSPNLCLRDMGGNKAPHSFQPFRAQIKHRLAPVSLVAQLPRLGHRQQTQEAA